MTCGMKTSFLILITALLAAGAAAAHAHENPDARRVAVTGRGDVSVAPDRALVSVGVEVSNAELKTAEAEANRVARAFLSEAKALGIADKDISSAAVNIYPEYVWIEQERRQKLTGYRASREMVVMLRDLNKVGELLLRATKAGANRVSPPQLESSKAKELTQQALVKAAEDARAKAKLLAETLGAKLGPVFRINAADAPVPPPMPMKAMAMRSEAADGNAEMGFSAGEIRVEASVTAEFDLLP